MVDDHDLDDCLYDLIQIARDVHEDFASDPELEFLSMVLSQAKFSDRNIHDCAQHLFSRYGNRAAVGFAVLAVERLIAEEDAAAMAYKRILQAIAVIEDVEPEPGTRLH